MASSPIPEPLRRVLSAGAGDDNTRHVDEFISRLKPQTAWKILVVLLTSSPFDRKMLEVLVDVAYEIVRSDTAGQRDHEGDQSREAVNRSTQQASPTPSGPTANGNPDEEAEHDTKPCGDDLLGPNFFRALIDALKDSSHPAATGGAPRVVNNGGTVNINCHFHGISLAPAPAQADEAEEPEPSTPAKESERQVSDGPESEGRMPDAQAPDLPSSLLELLAGDNVKDGWVSLTEKKLLGKEVEDMLTRQTSRRALAEAIHALGREVAIGWWDPGRGLRSPNDVHSTGWPSNSPKRATASVQGSPGRGQEGWRSTSSSTRVRVRSVSTPDSLNSRTSMDYDNSPLAGVPRGNDRS